MSTPVETTPAEVKRRLDAGESLTLVDVRETHEHEICHIEGASLFPMSEIQLQLDRLKQSTQPLVVFCHHGMRSLRVVGWLRDQGIADCQSMSGGIDAWSAEIDRAVPRY